MTQKAGNTDMVLRDKRKPKMVKTNTIINYQFTIEELAKMSQDLARTSIDKAQIEKDKKEIMDEFKSKTSKCDAEISLLSQKISNRYEMRRMDVMMHKDFDHGIKIYYDIKTGAELQRDTISSEDYQLDLEEQEAAVKASK